MFNQSKFIEKLQEYINGFTTCFYESAPSIAEFPYCILLPPATTDLQQGILSTFDIEIYSNELSGAEDVEALCDTLKNNLQNYLLNSENNFTSHISFESYYNLRENEHDILARRLTFTARIFYQ